MSWKEDLPQADDIQYSNWPQATSLSDYARSTREEVDFLGRLSRGATVYQAGSVNAPGISDLDFIVVLDDNDHAHQLNKWSPLHQHVSPVTQYLATHGPLVVNPGMWHGLSDFKVVENLKHVAGPVLAPPGSASQTPGLANLLVEAEFHIFRPYKRFLKEILRRQVQVRPALSRMLKIKVKATVLAQFGLERPKWSAFLEEITELRSNWFGLTMHEQISALYPLMVACAEIDAEMIAETSRIMFSAGMDLADLRHSANRVIGAFDYTTVFLREYDPTFSLEYAVKTHLKSGEMFFLLPANFMLPLLIYTSNAPTVRRYLHKRVTVFGESGAKGEQPLQQDAILPERVALLESYFQFLEGQNLDKGLFFRRSEAPASGTASPRAFWRALESQAQELEDIPVLVLRQQLADTRAQLQRIANNETLKVPLTMLIRYLRSVIAPPGSLRARIVGRPSRWLLSQFWRLKRNR